MTRPNRRRGDVPRGAAIRRAIAGVLVLASAVTFAWYVGGCMASVAYKRAGLEYRP